MVIDINLLRTERGGDPEIVFKAEKDRFNDVSRVQRTIDADKRWKSLRYKLDTLNRHRNACSKEVGLKVKAKADPGTASDLPEVDFDKLSADSLKGYSISQLKKLSERISILVQTLTVELANVEAERDRELNEIGNIIHPSVVISNNEDDNLVERVVGDCTTTKKHSHVDLMLMIDGADYKRGANVAGSRGYFLKGPGVFIAQALIQYSLKKLYSKGFVPLYTPFFMTKKMMNEVSQLSQFDDELYKILAKSEDTGKVVEEEKYLIATSEQPIAAYHRGEWLDPAALPLRYAGISSCFRQEVGSHGRDTTGIFRVHQFEKVEQFVICSPHDGESWKMMEEMISNPEELCKDLGLSYRIVSIVSGALNNAAAKKWDLEAWFPGSKAFRELVSCSNCTDYQSRRLFVRYGLSKTVNEDAVYVHMLNATMCAVTRVMLCLLETHQTPEGVKIPEVLHPYLPKDMHFVKFKTPAINGDSSC